MQFRQVAQFFNAGEIAKFKPGGTEMFGNWKLRYGRGAVLGYDKDKNVVASSYVKVYNHERIVSDKDTKDMAEYDFGPRARAKENSARLAAACAKKPAIVSDSFFIYN